MKTKDKFTRKDWELFQHEFNTLASELALHEWEVLHVWELPKDVTGAMACVDADVESMMATIYFTDEPLENPNLDGIAKAELITRVAHHEVLELLLYKMEYYARDREWSDSKYESERHNVIHKLQTIIDPTVE